MVKHAKKFIDVKEIAHLKIESTFFGVNILTVSEACLVFIRLNLNLVSPPPTRTIHTIGMLDTFLKTCIAIFIAWILKYR